LRKTEKSFADFPFTNISAKEFTDVREIGKSNDLKEDLLQ
jgi:hypothetical protein